MTKRQRPKEPRAKRPLTAMDIVNDIEGILIRFNKLDPNSEQTSLMKAHNDKDIILSLTKHFTKKINYSVERLAQIIMLLNFTYRHDHDRYRAQIEQLITLLNRFKFDFTAILNHVAETTTTSFYTNFIDVLAGNLEVLKQHITDEISTTELATDATFQRFTKKILRTERLEFDIKILDDADKLAKIIEFMQKFPLRSLLDTNKQHLWWNNLASLALRNNFPAIKQNFLNYAAGQLRDENQSLSQQEKEFLLEALNTNISVTQKLHFIVQLSKQSTNSIKEKLLELNLVSDLHNALMQQCKSFVEHNKIESIKSCLITPSAMLKILETKSELVKRILVADFSQDEWFPDEEWGLEKYHDYLTYFETEIAALLKLGNSIRNESFSKPITYLLPSFKPVLEGLISEAYNQSSFFGKSETRYFGILSGIKSNEQSSSSGYIFKEVDYGITYHGGKYLLSTPDTIAPIAFNRDAIDAIANYLLEQSKKTTPGSYVDDLINNETHEFLIVRKFSYQQPKTALLLFSTSLPQRSTTPAGVVSDGKEEIRPIHRAHSDPDLSSFNRRQQMAIS